MASKLVLLCIVFTSVISLGLVSGAKTHAQSLVSKPFMRSEGRYKQISSKGSGLLENGPPEEVKVANGVNATLSMEVATNATMAIRLHNSNSALHYKSDNKIGQNSNEQAQSTKLKHKVDAGDITIEVKDMSALAAVAGDKVGIGDSGSAVFEVATIEAVGTSLLDDTKKDRPGSPSGKKNANTLTLKDPLLYDHDKKAKVVKEATTTSPPATDTYEKLTTGNCPANRQVSKNDCLAAAKSVGADASKTDLDGGADAGSNGRPEGCTIHGWGSVEWWGPSDNADCGSLSYYCVCKKVAETTTITQGNGDHRFDDWSIPDSWDNGIPSGSMSAVVASGVRVNVGGHQDVQHAPATLTFSGSLTLKENSYLRLERSANAVLGASKIVMEEGSTILSNFPGQIDYPPIYLEGNAAVEARSTGNHWKTTTFNSITGDHILTIVGNNGHNYEFNAANTFSSLVLNAVDRYNVHATALNSLGSGNVTISGRASDGRSAQLFLDVNGTISDSATLALNGKGFNPNTNDRITVASGVEETIGVLIVDGVRQPAGMFDKGNADWLSGDGVLIVSVGNDEAEYFLADGGQSCEQACQNKGEMCDANSLKDAAASVATCKAIIENLGKSPQKGGRYTGDNSGCTYHPGQTGWYQVMRKDGDPDCSVVNGDTSRQRVCSCKKQAPCNPTSCAGLTCKNSPDTCCSADAWDCCGTGNQEFSNRLYCPASMVMCSTGWCDYHESACPRGVRYSATPCQDACHSQHCLKCANSSYTCEQCNGTSTLSISGECLPECPKGEYETATTSDQGVVTRTCSLCYGETRRRRAQGAESPDTCTPCPNGHISQSQEGQDTCQNIQKTCKLDECRDCTTCFGAVSGSLAGCFAANVPAGGCINFDSVWCGNFMYTMQSCAGFSLGCYHLLMCHSPCICPEWKNVRCGGNVTNTGTCNQSSLLEELTRGVVQSGSSNRSGDNTNGAGSVVPSRKNSAKVSLMQRQSSKKAALINEDTAETSSLDESLADKCASQCR